MLRGGGQRLGQHCCSCCPVPQPGVPAGLPRGHELSLGLTLCRLALPLCEALLELPQPRGPHLQSQSCRGCEGPPGLPQSHPQPVPHSSCTQSIPVGLGLSGKETPQPLSSVPGLCPPHSTAQQLFLTAARSSPAAGCARCPCAGTGHHQAEPSPSPALQIRTSTAQIPSAFSPPDAPPRGSQPVPIRRCSRPPAAPRGSPSSSQSALKWGAPQCCRCVPPTAEQRAEHPAALLAVLCARTAGNRGPSGPPGRPAGRRDPQSPPLLPAARPPRAVPAAAPPPHSPALPALNPTAFPSARSRPARRSAELRAVIPASCRRPPG